MVKPVKLTFKQRVIKKLKKSVSVVRRSILYYLIWPRYFRKYSKLPIDEKKVVIAYSELFKTMPDNLACMKTYLEAQGYRCVVIDHAENDPGTKNTLWGKIRGMSACEEFFREYATARALFLNEHFFPAYACQPREGQSVVQLWHACGAFKKWGYSTIDKQWGATRSDVKLFPIHNTYTHVCVSSPEVCFAYVEAFGCRPEIVMPLGVPRTDVYFDPSFVAKGREQLLELFPQIGSRKIILYAPTFRGNTMQESYAENMMDFEKMKSALGDDYVLVLKLHPRTVKAFTLTDEQRETLGDFVFDASACVEIDTALCGADIVISDYSSLVFEYSLLERPMMFFAYDLKEYDDSRSFYFDYESFVPGAIVTDTQQIIGEVRRLESGFDVERVRQFRNKFMSACDGKSIQRIAKTVLM